MSVRDPEMIARLRAAIARHDEALHRAERIAAIQAMVLGPIRVAAPDSYAAWAELTPREREICVLVARGASNKGAGRILGISPRTVEVHRGRAMSKLQLRTTAELVRFVLLNVPEATA